MKAWTFWAVAYLLLPLLGGALLHGLCMKYGWLRFLARPIDGGRCWSGRRLFGDHKTWRGLVATGLGTLPLFAGQALWLHYCPWLRALEIFDYSTVNVAIFGFLLGFGAMLGELPNSFWKRRLNVAPGESPTGLSRYWFYVLDQIDLLGGVWLVVALAAPRAVRMGTVVPSLVITLFAHQLVTFVGYALGMRETRR